MQRLIDTEFEDGHRYYTKEAHVADLNYNIPPLQ